LLKKEDVESYVLFDENEFTGIQEVSSINIIIKDCKKKKASYHIHGDVIFTDSKWNVSLNGYYALTFVVIDENYKIHLTAMSITKREMKGFLEVFHWLDEKKKLFLVLNQHVWLLTELRILIQALRQNLVLIYFTLFGRWHQRQNVLKNVD